MPDLFYSSHYSLDHAKRHIDYLRKEIDAWIKSHPYATVVETNADGTEDTHKVRLTQPMPVTVPGFTGDTVYNLRAALDQAGYAVAKAAGKSGKEAMFPFGKDAIDVVRRFGNKSKDIPKEIFDLMISFQPYEGGQTPLYAINKACNTNKHEITIPVLFYVGAVSLTGVMQRGFKWRNPPTWDAVKQEMEIVRVPHDVKPTYNLKLQPSVMICEVEGTGRAPLIGILTRMLFEAERVVAAIEAKARTMGLIS